jgi:S1/P1 Nuclease
MKRKLSVWTATALLLLGARPAYAWDHSSHLLVARIAWEEMTPQARARAIQIFQGAALDTRLRPGPGTLSEQRQINAFLRGATWPDDVRPDDPRSGTYHNRDRHFTDLFWVQNTDFGRIQTTSNPEEGSLLRDVAQLQAELVGADRERAAVALAWLEHLVGDIHQPLHASGRITRVDPRGDAGGTLFCLWSPPPGERCGSRNLHSFWDGSVTGRIPRIGNESDDAYLSRVALLVMQRHPRSEFANEIGPTDFRQWAQASVLIAQRRVYRSPLVRNQTPSNTYRLNAFRTAEPRIALAGYRLADLLNRALG